MNSFKLFSIGCKMIFFTHFLSFFCSVAMLCNHKMISIEQKISIFRFNQKSLNEFINKKDKIDAIELYLTY